MRTLEQRPTCACCGKLYGRRNSDKHRVSWHPERGETMPRYTGNLKVTGIERKPPMLNARGDRMTVGEWAVYRLWDGTWWPSGYEPFCTLRCALSFAQRAHKAGYRINRSKP